MGVPAFFRWLTRKYPSVIVHCIEEKQQNVDGTDIPLDSSLPNPNGVEFDNLYLDMNGIIHPCTHPEDKPAPKNEDEMMVAIFECIDRLFRIVRPRKVLYMAIDGVAPRAKMNQQRSRRFRASKETSEKIKEIERIREELMAKGCEVPPPKPKEEHFDSNCITPGTPFMDRLSKCLHYYIHERLNNDPGWKGIKVILSDANVPGEGEHKIMDYIRRQRAQPDHDPNTSHCLCGADADLIMLALATHEPNFTIIREEFKPNKPRPCEICGQVGHEMKDCLGLEKEVSSEFDEIQHPVAAEVEFIFVRINVLREYLEKELEMPNLPFKYELERAVDDWVFMCFFVGNDFLPHLPSLEIREGAIDRLVELYKKTVYKTGGWLTNSGVPDLNRVQLIMSDLGEVEDEIFRNRHRSEQRFKANQKRRKLEQQAANANCYNKPAFIPEGQLAPVEIGSIPAASQDIRQEAYQMRKNGMQSNRDAAQALKSMLRESPGSSSDGPSPSPSPNQSPAGVTPKRKLDEDSDEDNDEVRLWEDGFKDRYYESKFDVDADNIEFRVEVARQYVTGLCWVLRYYYQGCASWKWYFPYHYAPFASDFINIGDLSSDFERGTQPFKPLEQLMGVFPAASRSHVPEPWAELMTDPDSPIIDFYPEDFQIDLNGKKFAWQGVALLPFVEEGRLKVSLEPFYDKLTDEERKRNVRGDDRLYIFKSHTGYDFLSGLYENDFDVNEEAPLDPKLFEGANGFVMVSEDNVPYNGTLTAPVKGLLDIEQNQTICVRFRDPKFDEGYIFPAVRLPNAVDPPRVLKPGDLTPEQSRNWRPMIGMTHSNKRASLGASGHRMLAHEGYDRSARSGGGSYSNMPPPNNQYVDRHERGYQQHRSRPYDPNNRRGGSNSYNRDRGGGGGGSWNNNSGRNNDNYRSRDYGYSGPSRGGYGGGNSYRGGRDVHQVPRERVYGRNNSYSNYASQSYGYNTASGSSGYSSASSSSSSTDYSYNNQQGRYGASSSSYGSSGGYESYGYSTGGGSTSHNRRGDRHDQYNERDAGRRQEGYFTAGYFSGSSSSSGGNGNNNNSSYGYGNQRRYQ